MRRRRDPFARCTYVPVRRDDYLCSFCGAADPRRAQTTPALIAAPKARIYRITVENDSGRDNALTGAFCSWPCAEAYHGVSLGLGGRR